MKPFKNEVFLDFSKPEVKKKMEAAIAKVEKELGKTHPLIINGEKITTKETITSINPSNTDQIIGKFSKATREHAEQALKAAQVAFNTWKNVDAAKRADYLFKAAAEVRKRRYEIDALMVLEVGKNYLEADADTCEAIDFLEYYGREMLRLSKPRKMLQLKGEKDTLRYFPNGVGLIVAPWNFPFAILVGMTSSAIVTGNTVVVKPSSDSPALAALMMDIWETVKLPKGVANFVTGSGGEVGDYLVAHPEIKFISFTGSREVGVHINELAAKHQNNQKWIKRVIAEMGGKNAVIVDSEADIDEAVKGIIAAAFGYQGQKCSACSRVIALESVYDKVVEKLAEAAKQIKVGEAKTNAQMGPVINKNSVEKIMSYIEIGKKEGRLVAGGAKAPGNGYFIQPTIFADIKPHDRLAQEEIFGPVVGIIKVKDFDEAIQVANDTEYGLTGGVFTKNKKKIEQAINEFACGNLYINRKNTGAMVGVHPFGGFHMSGTNSKAGGPDYLLYFLQAKSVGEKII